MANTENEVFIPRSVLQTFENEIKNKTITDFNRKKKSKFVEIIKELNELLGKKLDLNNDFIYHKNEEKREKFMKTVVENLGKVFFENLNKEFEDNFFEEKELEKLFAKNEAKIFKEFEQSFNNEEKSLFNDHLKKVFIDFLFSFIFFSLIIIEFINS